ncbi:YdcF family protein [Tumidithrix elongata RA019]|uniref:YdcF family protein n=1 Tax=Tumidithrix elongata BACA0141 TaxID=2716417 RepID=A0AAW9PV75_9CYAN|nr:YdcF family protein [Tumidithrix elongata RA019]
MSKLPLRKTSSVVTLSGVIAFSWLFTGGLPSFSNLTHRVEQEPQAILVLGGSPSREKFAARFALNHPNLPIFVSSGSPEEYAKYVFDQAGVPRNRIHLDYRAVDTVTNFTTMVDALRDRNVTDVYLITSDFHMPRAEVIGNIVLGSRGIKIHPISIPSSREDEAPVKSLRDGFRSVVWLFTGSPLNGSTHNR